MPRDFALSTEAINSRILIVKSSTSTKLILISPTITTPLSRIRSKRSATLVVCKWLTCFWHKQPLPNYPVVSRPRQLKSLKQVPLKDLNLNLNPHLLIQTFFSAHPSSHPKERMYYLNLLLLYHLIVHLLFFE